MSNIEEIFSLDDQRLSVGAVLIDALATGDMYHVKAALALYPKLTAVIYNVNSACQKYATIAAYLTDSMSNAVYKSTLLKCTMVSYHKANPKSAEVAVDTKSGEDLSGKKLTVGGATLLIMHALNNSKDRVSTMQKIRVALTGGIEYDNNIFNDIPEDKPLILLNFRASGHHHGAHPNLDTGTEGMSQLVCAIKENLPNVAVVTIGECNPLNADISLGEYWKRTELNGRGRAAQAAFLNSMFEARPKLLGVIGMRSGVIDLLALLGRRVLSIDMSQLRRRANGKYVICTDSSWVRGLKLENAFGPSYGRVFIVDERKGKKDSWLGKFSKEDFKVLSDAIKFYFGDDSADQPARHTSHPLSQQFLEQSKNTLNQLDQLSLATALKKCLEYDYANVDPIVKRLLCSNSV